MSWVTKLKDATAAKTVRFWANRYRKQYGIMLDLKLDSRQRSVQAEVLPKGETVTITFSAQYRLLPEPGGGTLLTLSDIHSSREWLDLLLHAVTPRGVTIPLPSPYGHLLHVAL